MTMELKIYLLGLLTGGMLVIIVQDLIKIVKLWMQINKLNKELQSKYKSALKDYEAEVSMMDKDALSKMRQKASDIMDMVAEAYTLPDSHFESMGTTRDAHVQQLYAEYHRWIKNQGYPYFSDYVGK